MSILAIIAGFIVIITLNFKKVNMSICLLLGAITTALITGLNIRKIVNLFLHTTVQPMTVRLMIIVAVISGLGYLLKENNDLNNMIDSLYKIVNNHKVLTIVIPAIIGTLSVPGGAILSAPLIKKSSDKIKLSNAQKTSINIFFGHIIFFIYPLCNPMIVCSEVSAINRYLIIKYNLLIFLVGFIIAYFYLFNSTNSVSKIKEAGNLKHKDYNIKKNILIFVKSFSPILSILLLSIIFNIPFQYSVFAGLFVGAGRNLEGNNKIYLYWQRIKKFFREGINYKLVVLILAIMFFQAVIEVSGAVDIIVDLLSRSGIPLIIMIVLMGVVTGYLTGLTIAALGILIPIFIHLFPAGYSVPYLSLLYTASFTGYLLSPLHICFLLTKEYFNTKLLNTYRYLIIPLFFMILAAIFQIIFIV